MLLSYVEFVDSCILSLALKQVRYTPDMACTLIRLQVFITSSLTSVICKRLAS